MFANALVQVSGCVPDIICIAQITLEFVDYALIIDNRRLLLLRGEDLTDLFRQALFVLQFLRSDFACLFFTELADC